MTPAIPPFERLLQQHGDDLYRLALALTGDPRRAAAALRRAVRKLLTAGGAPPLPDLFAALLGEAPPEKRRALQRGAELPQQIQAALAQLPRPTRLAVILPALRSFEERELPPAVAPSPPAARALRRDGLLAIATLTRFELPLATLDPITAPEECRTVRAALARDDTALTEEPALRGHLGLCAECRAAAHTWRQIDEQVTDTLRTVLRPQALNPTLALELHALFDPSAAPVWRFPRWARIALVPLVVLAVVGFVVLPRAPDVSPPPDSPIAPAGVSPVDLIERARATLYQPPAADGVWQARYQIRWVFADQSVTNLNATLWHDTAAGRHRVQLVHSSGGAPYEYVLADGDGRFYYALVPLYGASVAPLLAGSEPVRLQMPIDPALAPELLAARLRSGAWSIADAYLRQAATAELQRWGQRTADDGAILEVIGFRAISPLSAPDEPGVPTPVTVLMSLEATTGALYEVREVIDAPGGGATASRTTWRFLGAEQVPELRADEAFSPRGWNGIGSFEQRAESPADATLPMLRDADILPLVFALTDGAPWVRLPAQPPTATTQALLVAGGSERATVAIYRGEGRTLTVRTQPRGAVPETLLGQVESRERLEAATIAFGPPGRADALLDPRIGPDGITYVTQVVGVGFDRAEFRMLVDTLTPVTADLFREQSALFAKSPPSGDVATMLLTAIGSDTLPIDGAARHTVARSTVRRNVAALPFADPFNLPPYGGRPATTITDLWARAAGTELLFRRSDDAGRLYEQIAIGPDESWHYDAARSQIGLLRFSVERTRETLLVDTGRRMAVQFLRCGAERVAMVDGGALELQEPAWHDSSCVHPDYAETLRIQRESRSPYGDAGLLDPQRPYLADLRDGPLTTRLFFDVGGRAVRLEVHAESILIESWELVREEQVAADAVPVAAFDTTHPNALVVDDSDSWMATSLVLDEISLATARTVLATPLFTLGDADALRLMTIERVTNEARRRVEASDPFEAAFWSGSALRMTYINNLARGTSLQIYQGSAAEFGAYLQAQARWAESEVVAIEIEGRQAAAWRVTTIDWQRWTLVLIDDTLIAIPAADPQESALPMRLQLVATE